MKVFLDTIGCRLNQGEIEIMAAQFQAAGHQIVASAEHADLVVINTCAVTSAAASDSRQKIRQAAKNPQARTLVTGCWATLEPSAARLMDGVEGVVLNQDKETLVADFLNLTKNAIDFNQPARTPLPGEHARTRAFIKVQDGCDNFCTFCVTRIARGKGISTGMTRVLQDVQRAIEGGSKEVVLSGVNLGSWGSDFENPRKFKDLIRAILDETPIQRLRLSSLEPWDLDQDFFDLWQNPRMCAHLHLPLQSGSDAVLRRMARKTSQAEFRQIVEMAHSICPSIAITTDVIVGFPGESENNFNETVEFVQEIKFSGGHVFTFSDRPGTAAAKYTSQIDGGIRKRRSAELRSVFENLARQYQAQFMGQKMNVLWESAKPKPDGSFLMQGLSGNYLRVIANSPENVWNQMSEVFLTQGKDDKIIGEIVQS